MNCLMTVGGRGGDDPRPTGACHSDGPRQKLACKFNICATCAAAMIF